MKKYIIALLLCTSIACKAQSQLVIELTPDEQKQVSDLYATVIEAIEKIDALHETLTFKYLYKGPYCVHGLNSGTLTTESEGCTVGNSCLVWDNAKKKMVEASCGAGTPDQVKDGWEDGFIYSTDFRFIVPNVNHFPIYPHDFYYTQFKPGTTSLCGIVNNTHILPSQEFDFKHNPGAIGGNIPNQ